MLGVGGAVVLLPLLTTFTDLSLKEASNITVVQVFASALASIGAYYRRRLIHFSLALYMGGAGFAGGLAGGYGSQALPSTALETLFLFVTLIAIALLFIPVTEPVTITAAPPFSRAQAIGLGVSVGALAGVLGAGGGFLIVPLLIGVLRLPTRLAIGTSPVVILVGAAAALAGKLVSGQVLLAPAVALVAGAMPSAYFGTHISRRLSPRALRLTLGVVLSAIAVRGAIIVALTLATSLSA